MARPILDPLLLLFLLVAQPPAAPQPVPPPGPAETDDVRCLRGIKSGLRDPDGRLSDWSFSNTSVCGYSGVSCWNPQESRVISLSLPGFALRGPVPSALQHCRAATALDLSGNALEGPVPPPLCDWLPFLVALDLSGNRLSGALPAELANCGFLNSLNLSGNQLSGRIPASLARLARLKALDLSGNQLQGQIPPQLGDSFSKASFSGNKQRLCGRPVSSRCDGLLGGSAGCLGIVVAAGVSGSAASLLLAAYCFFWRWRCTGKSSKRRRGSESGGAAAVEDGSWPWWAEKLRAAHNRRVPVSLFQDPIVKVRLAERHAGL